jgi:hypothetical protein
LAESGGERNDLLLRKLDDSEERAHGVEVLVIVEELTDVLEKLSKNFLAHISLIEDSLTRVVLLFANQKFLDARGGVRLVYCLLRLEILGEKVDEFRHIRVRNLVAEHVNELDASGFQDHEVVNRDTLLDLQLRHDQLLDVALEKLGRDAHISSTVLVSVAVDARSDNQVDHCGHLLPVCLLVFNVLLLHRLNERANERAHLCLEIAGELADKFHAVTAACLCIALLKIVFDVLRWLELILFQVLLGNGDVGHYQHLEEDFKILLDELSVGGHGGALAEVSYDCKDVSLALAVRTYFVHGDLFPDLLKEEVSLVLEELSKFELVELDHPDNLRSCLEKLLCV